jgi:hypothetical protein
MATDDMSALSGTYGRCTACGGIDVELVRPTGVRDLSDIGESAVYPTGYGCELCS